MEPDLEQTRSGRRIHLRGVTQGVGLRPFIYRVAHECGVTGRAINSGAGVTIDAFGSDEALDRMLVRLERPEIGSGEIEDVDWEPLAGRAPDAFEIGDTSRRGETGIALAPDLGTCPRCLEETFDPADRRYRYAFTSCTLCGPRFTIARELPYDRRNTSMDAFEQCDTCNSEYATAGGRRHHAETNACPRCGPELWLASPAGEVASRGDDALEAATRCLAGGDVLAVRGLGGYHLVADATDEHALARLRQRKRRPRKPFAIMVPDVAAARAVAHSSAAEETLLRSPEAPIVLLQRRTPSPVAEGVAPGLPWLGIMLPYTPLHHLLLQRVGRPLVMTSGNLTGEPIVCGVAQAEAGLVSLVDGFLHHDREITAPCDDSVAHVVAGAPALLRRSRGYVPRPLSLPRPVGGTVLACGAHLSNTFCLARGERAWLSQHLGDLESPEATTAYAQSIERMERWLGTRADVVAHDLHPQYESTRYARAREARLHVAVQHHHAHAVSAMCEHGLTDTALAVVFDGTGCGSDGTAWGGEVLLADHAGFERLATLRPIQLVGGEVAIREVWRLSLAMLEDAFDGAPPLDALPLFRSPEVKQLEGVRSLLARRLRCLPAHGAGRWFDALGALVLEQPNAAHQGDVAASWNGVADHAQDRPYPFALGEIGTTPLEMDLRPMVRAAVADYRSGLQAGHISGRFHATLARAIAAALERLRPVTGDRPVVLSGGCFQNRLLTTRTVEALGSRWRVHLHRRVPANDGGIALGQVLVADAMARRGAVPSDRIQ